MFLVDKYYNNSNLVTCHEDILQKLLDTFDAHSQIYENIEDVVKKPFDEFKEVIKDLESGVWRYANFQHLIVYGRSGCGKEYLVNKLLSKIYGKKVVKTEKVEYTISGYGNSKTKVKIKQSKYHIVIEPNSNGFDKYLIQEIIQNYARIELLNILKYKKLFKVVVVNKIDNLSYYAQASLRRTMEKYADTCKFIFISDQLSKIIEPIRSRCLLIRVPLPNKIQIMNTLLHISIKENIELSPLEYHDIISRSENQMNLAIWLLDIKKYGADYMVNWKSLLDKIILLITDIDNYNQLNILKILNKVKEYFYLIFITNIDTQKVMRNLMFKLLKTQETIYVKLNIFEITSMFERRISQGTRHIIHFEAYIIRLLYLLNKSKNNNNNLLILDRLRI